MSGYLLDTHVWLWHALGDERLPPGVRERIDGSLEECHLSPISIWEVGVLEERGRVRLQESLRPWLETMRGRFPLRPAPLTGEVALAAFEVELPHRDPADHFLAATARVYGLTLITADRQILGAGTVDTLSARD